MPWEYRFQPRCDAFIFQGKGDFIDDDLIRGAQALARDPHLRPDSRVFMDFSAIDEFKISPSAFETINALEAVKNIRGKHAFLIFGPLGSRKFHGHLRSLCSSSSFRMFTTRQGAYDWLNEGLPLEKHISGGPWHSLADLDAHYAPHVPQQLGHMIGLQSSTA